MQLNRLVKIKKKRKVIGRGGSLGGTSGKGHKGQKARSGGKVRRSFEGGQTPLVRRLPKRGFNNKAFRVSYEIVHFEKIIALAVEHNITEINKEVLHKLNIIKRMNDKVKVILKQSTTQVSSSLTLTVDKWSESVSKKIIDAGGQVFC
jgi:large subunit ribosomal protein L15